MNYSARGMLLNFANASCRIHGISFFVFKKMKAGVLLLSLMMPVVGKSDEVERASRLVSRVKQAVRGQGRYSDDDVSGKIFSSATAIAQLQDMKSPAGVAGLIEVILDPGFIEFDQKYGRTNNGSYPEMELDDPRVGLMLRAVWGLLIQPLVDEAAVPTIMLDKSREARLHIAYIVNHEAMVDDCSAWCLEVKEGRMTFQMEGDPIRYNRLGEDASKSSFEKRSRISEDGRQKTGSLSEKKSGSHENQKESPPVWIYLLLSCVIGGGLVLLLKKKSIV